MTQILTIGLGLIQWVYFPLSCIFLLKFLYVFFFCLQLASCSLRHLVADSYFLNTFLFSGQQHQLQLTCWEFLLHVQKRIIMLTHHSKLLPRWEAVIWEGSSIMENWIHNMSGLDLGGASMGSVKPPFSGFTFSLFKTYPKTLKRWLWNVPGFTIFVGVHAPRSP